MIGSRLDTLQYIVEDDQTFRCGTPLPSEGSEQLPLLALITSLSLRMGSTISVRGSTSETSGVVQAFSDNAWKGIANIGTEGTFSNPDLPPHYLEQGRLMVRVIAGDRASHAVWADPEFVHSRAISFAPTKRAGDDKAFFRWRLHWADWQPTGYKLQAGMAYDIWVEGDASDLTALIGVRGLARPDDRSVRTQDFTEVPLHQGFNRIEPSRSGLLHVRHCGASPCHIVIPGHAVPIPFFQYGNTYPDDFRKMLEKSDELSEVQLVGDRLVLTSYKDSYARFASTSPEELVKSHQEIIAIQAQAAGLTGDGAKHNRSNLWIYAVECASTDSPHAGTGYIGLPSGRSPGHEYMSALLAGQARNRWVTLHEYGHHFQNTLNSLAPMFDENSVNIYALAVSRIYHNEYTDVLPRRWEPLKAWLALPPRQKRYMESPDTQAIFEQLRRGFGDAYLPSWDRYVREHPESIGGLQSFTQSLSIVAGRNLAQFFVDWGVIEPEDAVWTALNALGLPAAPASLISLVPYT